MKFEHFQNMTGWSLTSFIGGPKWQMKIVLQLDFGKQFERTISKSADSEKPHVIAESLQAVIHTLTHTRGNRRKRVTIWSNY